MAKIQVGDKAPDFSVTTQDGETVRLADLLNNQFLVLFFYPKDGSPVCTNEACSFGDSYQQFAPHPIGQPSARQCTQQDHDAYYHHQFRGWSGGGLPLEAESGLEEVDRES